MNSAESTLKSELIYYKFMGFLRTFCFTIYFIINNIGKDYRISYLRKFKLVIRAFKLNKKKGHSLFLTFRNTLQHLILMNQVFRVPKTLKGDVVECGCCNGTSTISLSLACALTNRRLFVCDSFKGLPSPTEEEKYTIIRYSDSYYLWEEGDMASFGGLNGTRERIRKFGNIEVCQFVEGYFKDTLKDIKTDSIVLVFEDADLKSSVEDCLRFLWPKIQKGCKFFSHEPWSLEVVSLFYNEEWWRRELKAEPPGFQGSGKTISGLGFAMNIDAARIKQNGKKEVNL